MAKNNSNVKMVMVRKILNEKLIKLSGLICKECPISKNCDKENDCKKHRLINDIIEIID